MLMAETPGIKLKSGRSDSERHPREIGVSPGNASSASARSCAKKNCGALSAMGLPVRTSFAFMPRVKRPEDTRMKAMRSR